jgi:hypothetical protein
MGSENRADQASDFFSNWLFDIGIGLGALNGPMFGVELEATVHQ